MQSSPYILFISLGHELWAGGEKHATLLQWQKDFWKTLRITQE